jgi:hypothetical protein
MNTLPVLIPLALAILSLLICVVTLMYRVTKLESDLSLRAVQAGFVHRDHVRDPEHYDAQGHYRWR